MSSRICSSEAECEHQALAVAVFGARFYFCSCHDPRAVAGGINRKTVPGPSVVVPQSVPSSVRMRPATGSV